MSLGDKIQACLDDVKLEGELKVENEFTNVMNYIYERLNYTILENKALKKAKKGGTVFEVMHLPSYKKSFWGKMRWLKVDTARVLKELNEKFLEVTFSISDLYPNTSHTIHVISATVKMSTKNKKIL